MSLLQLFCLTWSLQRLARFKTHLSSLTAQCLSASWENASRRLQLWECLHLSYSFISAPNWILNVLTMSQEQGQPKAPDENAAAALNLPQSCLLALKLPTLITWSLSVQCLLFTRLHLYQGWVHQKLWALWLRAPRVSLIGETVLLRVWSRLIPGSSRTRVCTVPFFPALASMSLGSWALNFRGLRPLCIQIAAMLAALVLGCPAAGSSLHLLPLHSQPAESTALWAAGKASVCVL